MLTGPQMARRLGRTEPRMIKVTDACYLRNRHQEFLKFLKKVPAAYPGVGLHVACDNYSTHKHAARQGLAREDPRVTLHFTPTGCSWINLIECFISVITRHAIRPGSFTSVRELVAASGAFIASWTTTSPVRIDQRRRRDLSQHQPREG